MTTRDPKYTDQSAERALLGAMLTDNRRFIVTANKVGGPDFSDTLHTEIFICIAELVEAGKFATPVTVKAYMQQKMGDSFIRAEAEGVRIGSYLAHLAAETDDIDPLSLAVRIRQLAALHTIVQLAKSFAGHEVDDILNCADCLALDGDFIAKAMRGGSAPISEPHKKHDHLEKLRSDGWNIAVHNDFSGGVYWMMTHSASGRFIWTTAEDDATALRILHLKSGAK